MLSKLAEVAQAPFNFQSKHPGCSLCHTAVCALQVITSNMRGYIVADDVSSVLLIAAAQEGDFELWHQLRQQHFAKAASQHDPAAGNSQHGSSQLDRSAHSQGGSAHGSRQQEKHGVAAGKLGGLVRPLAGKRGGQPQSWRTQLMRSSSLLLHKEPPPRGMLAAIVPSRWSEAGVSVRPQAGRPWRAGPGQRRVMLQAAPGTWACLCSGRL